MVIFDCLFTLDVRIEREIQNHYKKKRERDQTKPSPAGEELLSMFLFLSFLFFFSSFLSSLSKMREKMV